MIRFVVRVFLLLTCAGSLLAHAQSVIINELMYNTASHATNQEWIELHNSSPTPVNLLGWKFTKGIDFTFTYTVIVPVGGFVVVAADPAWFGAAYPAVDPDFIVGRWAGTLANGGETIRLDDAQGNKVDEIGYSKEGDWAQRTRVQSGSHFGWDWVALHDGMGKSVEVINPKARRDSGQNWAASTLDGGTPGFVNSVFTTNSPALILETAHLPLIPRPTNSVIIKARIVDPQGSNTTVRLLYRVDANPQSNPFTTVPMLDDGLNGDGAANDGVYGAVLPARPNGTIIEYYVRAVTSTGITNTWPARASISGTLSQAANALYQVDDSDYSGGQPIYRLIMTAAELATLNQIVSSDRNSDAAMNGTLVSVDGFSSELRYLLGIRIRGAGSRGTFPPNLRADIPADQPWKGISAINLNTQYTHSQMAGYALAARSGLNTDTARAVQVRVNGANLASANSPQFGSYVALEVPNGDYVDAHFPQDNAGNLYRASSGSHSATLAYLGTNISSYTSSGYSKQNNTSENDWSDLFNLTFALSTGTSDANYVQAVRQNIDVDAWMLYFALFTLTESEETSLGTGTGDDFALYRGLDDPRFLLLAHDWDTILNQGQGSFSVTRDIFRAGNLASINRFIRHPEFVPTYYATLKRLLDTTFSNEQESRTLDEVLGSWVPASTITAMKTFATNRNAYVLSQIPLQFTVQAPALSIVSGYPRTFSSPVALSGFADAINTRTILVNGSTSTWSAVSGFWSHNAVALQPGINRILVQALGTNGLEFARTNLDVWYDVAGTPVSGTISSDADWAADSGPYTVSGTLTIASGATLTIEPGASIFLGSGASISVANGGRLLAEGTPLLPIRFTRIPGTLNAWGGITVNGAAGSPETRIAYAHLEFNSASAINVQGGEVLLDHLTFGTTDRRYINLDGASFIVSDCLFPATTASLEPIHGTGGIRNGGHGIFTRNFCGRVNGYNDTIDFTGGARPGPIVHFIDNVFMGTDDDVLDLDSTDAWVEGNIFLHTHRNGSPDSSSGVSGGNDNGQPSRITIIGNIFYDMDQAATAKQGNFYTFINNTVVRQNGAGFGDSGVAAVLNFADEGIAAAVGMFVEGNIIVDAQRLTRNVTNGTALASNTTFNSNLMPFAWAGPGTNNSTNNPFLKYLPQLAETTNFTTWKSAQVLRDWFTPRPGSPAVGTGPNGRDKGGVIPFGASISGEPPATTATNAATLVVGLNRSVPGWPDGSGFTHYKWRLDGGAWSAETPLATPITLNGLANGPHHVDVSGKRDSGLYQDDPMFAPDAVFTASRTWAVTNVPGTVIINEILARNVQVFVHEGETPDVIELFNPGSSSVDLAGKGITDDPINHYKFVFPAGTVLAPGQYVLVFADTSKLTSGLHLGFGLNQSGDTLYLYESAASGGALLDSVAFGLQLDDLSIGRVADGSWALNYPTLGTANQIYPVGDLSGLKINEWLADATVGKDFVEVLNLASLPVDIGGSFFSDTPIGAPLLSQVPALSFLAANSYFPFVADGDPEQGADHLAFKLSPDEGAIGLFAPDGTMIDSVLYGPQTTDISEGMTPNGSKNRAFFVQPTPGAPNPFVNSTITISNSFVNLANITAQIWTYDNSGTDYGTTWRQTGFNDSGWLTGQGIFGYETSPQQYPYPFNTFIPAPNQANGHLTVYYRTHFQWTNSGPGWELYSTNYVDDGAVFYINGVEAGRVRINANPVLYSSSGQTQQSEGQADVFPLSTANLVNGDNVLAVEVHQSDSGSSDDVFGLSLTAVNSTTSIITATIVLNEVMANNKSFTNQDGTITDWVEIYNPSADAFDLSDTSLSDDVANPRRWVFPAGVSIPSLGYLIVKFDSSAPASTNAGPDMNTGFGFDAGGDKVLLFDRPSGGGALLDSIQFGLQAADFTIGRIPNGTGAWSLTLPTETSLNIVAAVGNSAALRVNEWMADPKPGDDDYFELYNPNPQPVALGGLYLTDNLNNRTQYRIPNLSFIGVNVRGFVRFLADSDPGKGADHVNFKLSGSGEAVGLFAADGFTTIDAITFGAQQSGVSEGRFPDGSTNITRFPKTPTPGQSNFLPFDDVVINEALSHTDLPLEDAIELFNPTANPVNIGGWYLSDSQLQPRKFRIPENTILQPGGFTVFYEYQFNPTLLFPSFSLSSGNGDEVFLSVADTNGNLTGYRTSVDFGPQVNGVAFGRFATSIGFDFVSMSARTLGADNPATVEAFRAGQGGTNAYPKVGPVVINELHYHPPDLGTNDNSVDEFIELYNFSTAPVPLYDMNNPANTWHLRSAVDFDFATNTWIPAGGYLVVVGFDPATNAAALTAFRAFYGIGAGVAIVGPFDGKLNNEDDEVRLNKPDEPNIDGVPYVLVERVHYRDSTPWPSAADGSTNGPGISLQRVVAQNYANDPVNWIAGVPTPGAASGAATLTPPAITLQPTNRTELAGASVTFVSAASGAAPLRYQWRFNGFDVPEATNASLTVASVQTTNVGAYSVRVVNSAGVALSASAMLALQALPQIVFEPQSKVVAAGDTAIFTVGARGTPPLAFQWWRTGGPIGGATQPSLVLSNVQSGDLGNYFVIITNVFGSATSTVASLQLSVPPQIVSQPTNQTVIIGQTVSLNAVVTGSTPLSYQWFFNGGLLSGATSSNLVFANVQPSRTGVYSVLVSNIVGTVLSSNASLVVIVPPTVTVVASDPNASEAGSDPGVFTITRNGSNNFALTVSFNLGGTAGAGDYQAIPLSATIPLNANSVTVTVTPVDDAELESSETVILGLQPALTYLIGSPSNAIVTIADNDNLAPGVVITSPANGTFAPVIPTNLFLAATASDPNPGQAVTVSFYFGTNSISPALAPPYQFTWTNPPSGSNLLVAVATDVFGLNTTSAPVELSINGPPNVNITSPTNGATVSGPGNVFITAVATDTNGGVAQVDFYVAGAFIGSSMTAPYSVTFSNAALGPYQTFAVARDNFGLISSSPVVSFTVSIANTNPADGFNNRGVINGFTNFLTANNNTATLEGGEPNHYFSHAVKTMWIQWTAPASGTVMMDTVGSAFDTILAVYTNQPGVALSFASLVQVAVNDDSVGLQSRVQFAATAGTVYYIAIAGYDTATPNGGAVQFHLGLSNVPVILLQPVIIAPRMTNGVFSAVLSGGNTNRNYYIETTANLTNWIQLLTVSNATGQVSFTDTNVLSPGTLRAYRARLAP